MKSTTSRTVTIAATGVANLASLCAALNRAGATTEVTDDPKIIAGASRVILPGVGAFGPAMESLRSRDLDGALIERFSEQKPLMGICLGMHLFFEASAESPGIAGLGVLKGCIEGFLTKLPVPHLGWNRVEFDPPYAEKSGWAYFAHSYKVSRCVGCAEKGSTTYGETFISYAIANSGSLLLCQFHPELSGAWGHSLLCNWLK